MKLDRVMRTALALLIAVALIVAAGALLFVTESALNVWDRLRAGPVVFLYLYVAAMVLLASTALWLIWRLLIKREIKPVKTDRRLSKEDIRDRIGAAAASGVDVSAAQAELKQLAEQQQDGQLLLCFFGEVSSGKSSLIKALVPDASVLIDVVGGSTTEARRYRWRSESGREILLTDVPGTGGHEEGLTSLATEEAKRAHVVLFVCDSDLTRADMNSVRALLEFDKPIILVLNKADRYSDDEQAALMQKLLQRVEELGGVFDRDQVVAVSAGGAAEVIEQNPDGSESVSQQQRGADIGVLVVAIDRMVSDQAESLDLRRERAIFQITAEKLRRAEAEYRKQRAEQIIRSSTRKAVIGALAAVSPGTDVIVQGYLGTAMTRELCSLYSAAPRDLDVEEFLTMSQSRAGRALPLSLAVAGNGLKAFPGLGTVAGGLVHAVAYGLIFDALGRSLVLTLSRHGELVPEEAAKDFEEGISEHLEAGVRRVAKMALEERKG